VWFRPSYDTIDDGMHGAREVAPLSATRRERALPFLRQLIHPSPTPVDLGPGASG